MTDSMKEESIRLGVFYDGGWFGRLWLYMATASQWKAGLALSGVHDVLRWYVHRNLGHSLASIKLDEAHYVLGRPPELSRPGADGGRWIPRGSEQHWDQILQEEGVTRHDAYLSPRKDARRQVGADVTLALVTSDRAMTADLDIVVLIAPDAHMVPSSVSPGTQGHGDRPEHRRPRPQLRRPAHANQHRAGSDETSRPRTPVVRPAGLRPGGGVQARVPLRLQSRGRIQRRRTTRIGWLSIGHDQPLEC